MQRIIHQIWMGPAPKLPYIGEWRRLAKSNDCGHFLWDEKQCLNIIGKYGLARHWDFLGATKDCWNGRSDLARWCIVYECGGIYLDADIQPVRWIPDMFFTPEIWATWESEKHTPGIVASGAFGACAGNEMLSEIIAEIALLDSPIPAWQKLGPGALTRAYQRTQFQVYPSYYFCCGHHRDKGSYKLHPDSIGDHKWYSTQQHKGLKW